MEKRGIVLFVFLLAIGLVSSANIYVDPVSISPIQGDTFNVTIRADAVLGDTDLHSAQFDLLFDPTVLSINSIGQGDFLNEGGAVYTFFNYSLDNVNGIINDLYISRNVSSGIYGSGGALAVINFSADNVGTSSLGLNEVIFVNSTVGSTGANLPAVTSQNGSVNVLTAPCILGSAYWTPTGSVLEGSSVTLTVTGTNCDGLNFNFSVWEDDTLSGDDATIVAPVDAVFSSGIATTTWDAEWQDDGVLDHTPEYYFIATQVSDASTFIQSNTDLSVDKLITENELFVDPTNTNVVNPQSFSIQIKARAPVVASDIFGAQYTLVYNSTLLSLDSVDEGDLLNEGGSVNTIFNYTLGTDNVTIYNWRNVTNGTGAGVYTDEGILTILNFTSLVPGSGTFVLSDAIWVNSSIDNSSVGEPAFTITNGNVVVSPAANVFPFLSSVECSVLGTWQACSSVAYGDTLEGIRATCTDSDGSVGSVTFSLDNVEDSSNLYSGSGTQNVNVWSVAPNLLIEDSGNFNLNVTCTDNYGAVNSTLDSWLINWGTLNPSLVYPSVDTNVTQNDFFWFNSTLSCTGGECGDVSVTLDPLSDDSTWTPWFREDFDTAGSLTNGQTLAGGNLTVQIHNSASIDVGSGFALVNTSNFDGVALIHSTSSLPDEYKIRTRVGNINYDYANYEQADFDDWVNFNNHSGNYENGFYLWTITNALCNGIVDDVDECDEDWWHYHRKMVMDTDDHVGAAAHPLYMIYMEEAENAYPQGNVLNPWDGVNDVWNDVGIWNWDRAYTYAYDTYYVAEVEKRNNQIILRLYDDANNVLEETTSAPLANVHDYTLPDIFYMGEPHSDDYEGDASIDYIEVLVPLAVASSNTYFGNMDTSGFTNSYPGSISYSNTNALARYTATGGEVISYLNVYTTGAGTIDVGVYEFDGVTPTVLVGSATITTASAEGWYGAPASITLEAGKEYVLAVGNYNGPSVRWGDFGSQYSSQDDNDVANVLPALWSGADRTYRFGIFANYTAAGVKGAVPMNSGTPFYTITQNPDTTTCTNLKAGDSCSNSWRVNSTGAVAETYDFFTIYDAVYSGVTDANSPSVALTIDSSGAIVDNPPSVNLDSPADATTLSASSVIFNATVSDDNALVNVSLYVNGVLNETNVSGVSGFYEFTKTLGDGAYTWSIEACDSGAQCVTSATRTFSVSAFVAPCLFTDAIWSQTDVINGTSVNLIVNGTNCNLQEVNFTVLEYDTIGADDSVLIEPVNANFVGDAASGTWQAEWQGESWPETDPPEYYFVATEVLNASNSISSSGSNLLRVNSTNAVCGNSVIEGSEQCDISNLGSASCVSEGYLGGGTLGCNIPGDVNECQFDYTNCVLDDVPVVNLVSPTNTATVTSSDVNLVANVYDDAGVSSVTLYLDGVYDSVNISGMNNTDYRFSKTLVDGSYSWIVEVCDVSSQCVNSSSWTFSVNTVIPDTTPPVLSGGLPTGTLPAGTSTATLQVTTDEAATCRYSDITTIYSIMTPFTSTGGTDHSSNVDVSDGQSYVYYFSCQDTSGNVNESGYNVTFDVDLATNPYDLNGDGIVTIVDISIAATSFGSTCSVADNWCSGRDIDQNGLVNILDLSLIGMNFT